MRSVGVPAGLSQGRRLPAVLWIGLAPLFLTGGSASSEQRCPSQYLGVWEYRQRAGDGYDIEGERIELPDLKVTSSGTLTFTVTERALFLHRPKNLQEVRQNRLTAAGFTRDILHMQGRLDQGNLALTCVSRASSCPEDLIVFHKGSDAVLSRPEYLIGTLGLIPHPEGGHYGELYRSAATVLPADGRGQRASLTTIYFLLTATAVGRWHRVQSDEVWHFYEGAALDLWMAPPDWGEVSQHRLGPLDREQRPAWTVPAGWWQAARSTGPYSLVGCTVGPGFDFRDFALAADQPGISAALRARHPELTGLL